MALDTGLSSTYYPWEVLLALCLNGDGGIKAPRRMNKRENNSGNSGIKDKRHTNNKVWVLVVVINAAGGLNRYCNAT